MVTLSQSIYKSTVAEIIRWNEILSVMGTSGNLLLPA